MKISVLALVVLTVAFASPAMAYENFIPLGTGYSTDVDSVPSLNSQASKVIGQTDIYESEIYRKARAAMESASRAQQYRSNPNYNVTSDFIDY